MRRALSGVVPCPRAMSCLVIALRVVRCHQCCPQHALYRAAKADPGRRFHALYTRSAAVTFCGARESRCAGITARRVSRKITPAAVEEYGVSRTPGPAWPAVRAFGQ
jgi:hypothetical protein